MKKCPYCKIEVGGNPVKCPLCQSRLIGEGERPYFPEKSTLQFRSFLYKIQMFIAWAVIIAALGMDFLLGVRFPSFPDLHWGLIIVMWTVAFEFVIMKQFKPGTASARKLSIMVFLILILLTVTSYYFDFLWLTKDWIIPITIAATLVVNFVLTMLDKQGNAITYLLTCLFFGLVPFWVMYILRKDMPMTWSICLIVSITVLAAAIIFKGRTVAREFQRRFHI
ncbi:MAG: hypothetical protein K6F63_08780 [Lachnospiraceae bacterium]|nr:hypothetical protein [Lachnospiraceae bacterium]